MPVVRPFNGGFEAERKQQADADGSNVNQEILLGVDALVRRVNFKHGF
jgi:hypothetical protein